MTAVPEPSTPRTAGPTDAEWSAALDQVLAAPSGRLRGVLQPIVDLRRGSVVGYEMLSRFSGAIDASPDRWFAAAERSGVGPALAEVTVELGLERLAALPPNTFLTINLEPAHLHDPRVLERLCSPGRLDRLMVEITEHAAIAHPVDLADAIAELRARGGRIALDDAGSGYAGLTTLLDLRPELVKLDGGLVSGVDTDPVKRTLLRAIGEVASSIDAWVLAEGIETTGELSELVALEIPLGQGWALGRPADEATTEVPAAAVEAIAAKVARTEHHRAAIALLEQVPLVRLDAPPALDAPAIVVDELRRPVACDPGDGTRDVDPLVARPSEHLTTLARRVAARPGRWDRPVVLTDGRGAAVGVVDVRRLLDRLAEDLPAG